jgi:DNA-binding transcriptional regulator YiaG
MSESSISTKLEENSDADLHAELKQRIELEADYEAALETEFAALLGVRQCTVSKWEAGSIRPHPRHVRKIAELLFPNNQQLLLPDAPSRQ